MHRRSKPSPTHRLARLRRAEVHGSDRMVYREAARAVAEGGGHMRRTSQSRPPPPPPPQWPGAFVDVINTS